MSPWLLWGVALGAVPILIQWLHRRKYTERIWAAMRFLQAATKSQSRRLRLESLLLLLIRTLVLVLVALALAEPFLKSADWLPQAESNEHRLIVLDTSLSMQYEREGRAVSERAREAAHNVVAATRPGDSCQIVTIDRDGGAVVRQPAFDSAEVLAEIDQLRWTEEFGAVPPTLELAQSLLAESPPQARLQVTIISDFQRSNWWPDAPSERTRIQRSVASLADRAELSIVHVGLDESPNAAITDLNVEPSLVTVGTPAHVTATIQWSRGRGQSLPVELVEDGRVLHTQTVEIGADAKATASFTTLSRNAEQRRLEVRIPPDALPADNHRWVTIDARDELAVLLVNGRTSASPLGQATDFVQLALAPLSPSESARRQSFAEALRFRPVVVNEAEFTRTDLSPFDCVVLCDLPLLGESESARLNRFVSGGGGLVIGLGEQVQPDAYNQWFSAAGGRLMPVQLGGIVGEEDSSREPFHFAEPASRHPIIEPFLGNPQAGLTTANVYRYFRVELEDQNSGIGNQDLAPTADVRISTSLPARVALAFSNGDPAVVEHVYGTGRVLLVMTSLDDRWGSWALWPSFLPMIHRMVHYAVSGRTQRSQFVGDRLRREYPVQTVGVTVTVERPDGRRSPGRAIFEGAAMTATFEDTRQSGIYRMTLGPPLSQTELIAVNIDPRESDPRTLSERELASTLLAGLDARVMTPGAALTTTSVPEEPAFSITRWLLFVAIILLLVEQLMAWNSRYGLGLLAASPLLVAGFLVLPAATVILILAGLCGLLARQNGLLTRAK